MRKSHLVALLQASIDRDGDSEVTPGALLPMAFEGTTFLREHHARQAIILEIIRAKRDAGFPRDAVFFTDVWPPALAALKRAQASLTDYDAAEALAASARGALAGLREAESFRAVRMLAFRDGEGVVRAEGSVPLIDLERFPPGTMIDVEPVYRRFWWPHRRAGWLPWRRVLVGHRFFVGGREVDQDGNPLLPVHTCEERSYCAACDADARPTWPSLAWWRAAGRPRPDEPLPPRPPWRNPGGPDSNSRAGTVPPPSPSTVDNNRCPSADRSLSDVGGRSR